MSTFQTAKMVSKELTSEIYLERSLAASPLSEWTMTIDRLLIASKIKGARKLKNSEKIPSLKHYFAGIGHKEAAKLAYQEIFAGTKKPEKKLLSQILRRFDAGDFKLDAWLDECKPELVHFFWLSQNLLHHLLGAAFTPIEKTEVVLNLSAKVLPEGKMPLASVGSVELARFASRILRDKESPDNPWVSQYGFDRMAHKHWRAEDLDLVLLENRTAENADLRIISDQKWTQHLVLNEVFESAA